MSHHQGEKPTNPSITQRYNTTNNHAHMSYRRITEGKEINDFKSVCRIQKKLTKNHQPILKQPKQQQT
jgi:hypothetical protein